MHLGNAFLIGSLIYRSSVMATQDFVQTRSQSHNEDLQVREVLRECRKGLNMVERAVDNHLIPVTAKVLRKG